MTGLDKAAKRSRNRVAPCVQVIMSFILPPAYDDVSGQLPPAYTEEPDVSLIPFPPIYDEEPGMSVIPLPPTYYDEPCIEEIKQKLNSFLEAEERAKKEAEERAKKEAEERAKKEAEERAKKEAEKIEKLRKEEHLQKNAEAKMRIGTQLHENMFYPFTGIYEKNIYGETGGCRHIMETDTVCKIIEGKQHLWYSNVISYEVIFPHRVVRSTLRHYLGVLVPTAGTPDNRIYGTHNPRNAYILMSGEEPALY